MARCAYCDSRILMGGVTHGAEKFCNATCRNNAFILHSQNVAAEILDQKIEESK